MANSSPFKFLDAYTKEDRDIFFGREEEVDLLYSLVFQSNLTLVYGQSGTGKTSLVQCGLANRFAVFDWFDIYVRRAENISSALLRALQKIDVAGSQKGTLRERLMEKRQQSGRAAQRESSAAESHSPIVNLLKSVYKHYFKPIYLIFDQFEELFILGERQEQEQFYAVVAEILELLPFCKILIIMREESIAQLYEFERVVPTLFDKRLRVEPMSRLKAREVIERTTEKFDISLDGQETSERIIDAIRSEQGRVELTYLQVFLDKLFQQATAGKAGGSVVFDGALVTRCGTIDDVLAEFLGVQTAAIQQELSAAFPKASPTAVRRLLNNFVTLEGTKRPMTRPEIRLTGLSASEIDTCLSLLENGRLLRLEEGAYELAHDTLARHIAALRSAEEVGILQVSKLVRDRRQVYQATRTLLNDNEIQLVNAYRQVLIEENIFSPEEWNFIDRSRAHNRRRRILLIALIIGAIGVLSGFSLFSYSQWQSARINEAAATKNLALFKDQLVKGVEARYNEFLQKGNALFAKAQYEDAIAEYANALKALDDFRADVQQFQEGDSTLVLPETGDAARQRITEARSLSGVRSQFETLIREGDRLYNNGSAFYIDARDRYRQALELNYDNSLAQSKINTVNGRLEGAFDDFVRRGNTFFDAATNASAYRFALEQYRQAARIKPGDAFVQRRIRECMGKTR